MDAEKFERVIHEDNDKGTQLRVTISSFRDVVYLHIRKYYLSFEGEWMPTKEGVSMPLTLNNSLKLFLAMADILSEAEIELVREELLQIIHLHKQIEK